MKKFATRLILSLVTGLFCLAPLSILAQDSPGPIAEIWLITPKAGHSSEFRAALKAHTEVRVAQGDPRAWQVYTAIVGDQFGRYAIRNCCVQWADLDTYQKWDDSNMDVFGDWMENVDPHVEKTEHYFSEVDWAHSNFRPESGPFKYFMVNELMLKRGMEADFAAAKEAISQIALNQGWATADRNWIWTKQIGGTPLVSVIVPHKNYASMGGGEENFTDFLAKHMNSRDAAAELLKKFTASTESTSTVVWEHLPDLSMSEDD